MDEKQRAQLIEDVHNLLWHMNDDELVKVALVTGYSVEEIVDLGGLG